MQICRIFQDLYEATAIDIDPAHARVETDGSDIIRQKRVLHYLRDWLSVIAATSPDILDLEEGIGNGDDTIIQPLYYHANTC